MEQTRGRDPKPRRQGGGRSTHYAARREERGTIGQHAAEWSDAAAHSVFAALHAGGARHGTAICRYTEEVLTGGQDGLGEFVAKNCGGICAADKAVAMEVMLWHAHRLAQATARGDRVRRTRTFLKPLRERARARGLVGVLDVGPCTAPATDTFHKWLAADLQEVERRREMAAGGRTQAGLAAWPLGWMTGWGAVCYERAAERLLVEGSPSAPSEAMVRRVVRTDCLPTAVASAADHYVLVGPGGSRYMSVEEVARAFGIAGASPLTKALTDPAVMTAVQAVSCLGRSVHVGVARLILAALLRRRVIRPGLTYGSAYSGVDGVAAALEMELGARWHYRFASDVLPRVRSALLRAWGGHGLAPNRCHADACGGAATCEETVDLWAATPSCEAFSRRNRGRSREAQCASLREVWASLGYVRSASPSVILVENVDELEVTTPLTGLLQRLAGYTVETAVLDPRTALGEPMARVRRFWVLVRDPPPAPQAAMGVVSSAGESEAQDPMGAAH